MLLGFASRVARVSLLSLFDVDVVIQTLSLNVSLMVKHLDTLLDIAGPSIFVIPVLERIVSCLHQLLFRSKRRVHCVGGGCRVLFPQLSQPQRPSLSYLISLGHLLVKSLPGVEYLK